MYGHSTQLIDTHLFSIQRVSAFPTHYPGNSLSDSNPAKGNQRETVILEIFHECGPSWRFRYVEQVRLSTSQYLIQQRQLHTTMVKFQVCI